VALDRKIAQKQLDLRLRSLQVLPRTHPMEMDVAPNPIAVTAFGADGVMFQAHYLPHLIQQFEFGVGDDQVGTPSSPTGRFPGLTSLIHVHKLLTYANETRN